MKTKDQKLDALNEDGITIVEIIVSLLLLGIMAMGVTKSLTMTLKTAKLTEYNHIASSLATSKMELLAAKNISSITTADSGTESNVAWPHSNATFTRVTTVTENADDSRTVTIVVTVNNPNFPTSVEFTNTFAQWE